MTVSAGIPTGPGIPDWTPPASVQERLTGVRVSVLEFDGVDRTGVADSATGLAEAFASGHPLVFPYGTYRSLSGLTLPATGADILLDDAELDFSDIAVAGTAITAAGSLGSWVNVNAVAFGATAITGSAGIESGFAAGDIIKLRSTDVYDPARTATTGGEQGVVASTASGVINLRSPVMGAYSTGVQVAKITRSSLAIKGTGRITGGGSGSEHTGLTAKWIDGLRIDGPKIEWRGCERIAMALWDCVDFEVAHVDVEGSNYAGTGYGLTVTNACQFGRVHHSHFRDCRHATSTNNSSTDNAGLPRHITFDHNEVRDTTAEGMDAHAAAEYINFEHNRIYDATSHAINIECSKASAVGNRIYRATGNGIMLLAAADVAAEYEVRGNKVYDVDGYGTRFHTMATGSTPAQLDIVDNRYFRCGLSAIYADPSTAGYRMVGADISRNRGYSCNSLGGTATVNIVKADASQVLDNIANEVPSGIIGQRLNDVTRSRWSGVSRFSAAHTSTKAFYGLSVADTWIGVAAMNASGAGTEGLELDAASANCVVLGSGLRGAAVPLQLNGVTSHITTTADAGGAYNKVA